MNDLTLQKARAYEAEHGAAISPASSKTNSAPPLQKRLLLTLNGMIQIRTYYL